MINNTMIINSIFNYNFNFKNFLQDKDTIIWKNCSNLKININSKINKLIFIKCNNIKLSIADTIIGLEIDNCKKFKVKIKENKKVNCIELFKSDISLNKKNVFLLTENSKIKYS